jgi:hypothetical protein
MLLLANLKNMRLGKHSFATLTPSKKSPWAAANFKLSFSYTIIHIHTFSLFTHYCSYENERR